MGHVTPSLHIHLFAKYLIFIDSFIILRGLACGFAGCAAWVGLTFGLQPNHWRTIFNAFEICMTMSDVKLIPITTNQSATDIDSISRVFRTIGI